MAAINCFSIFALICLATFSSGVEASWKVLASTNVTTVQAGEPFSVRCEVSSPLFDVRADDFEMDFHSKQVLSLAYYYVSPASAIKARKTLFYSSLDDNQKRYIQSVAKQENSSYSAYKIVITPKAEFNATFFCKAWYKKSLMAVSNETTPPLSVILPPPKLASNVSQVVPGHPFTLTCSLGDHFEHQQAYSVKYFNSRNGLLATYEVDAQGEVFLASEQFANVTANLGARVAYPVFDLEIIEKVDRKQSYWCQLVVASNVNRKYESLHWKPVGPFVDFTSIVGDEKSFERRGRCTVDDFEHLKTEYKVQFYSDLGENKSENLLGYYWIRPNKITQFVAEHQNIGQMWSSIIHGSSIAYPNFEIITRLNSNFSNKGHGNWWCVLSISQPEQNGQNRLVRSNTAIIN